jgi:hypothetical protein
MRSRGFNEARALHSSGTINAEELGKLLAADIKFRSSNVEVPFDKDGKPQASGGRLESAFLRSEAMFRRGEISEAELEQILVSDSRWCASLKAASSVNQTPDKVSKTRKLWREKSLETYDGLTSMHTPEKARSARPQSDSNSPSPAPYQQLGDPAHGSSASQNKLARQQMQRRRKQREAGISRFNLESPKVGVKYLQEQGLLGTTAEEVARFLLSNNAKLSKRKLGQYFGSPKEFEQAVLLHFIEYQADSFGGMDIDKALRKFLVTFRLPGEALQVDRIMEQFAHHFCRVNSGGPLKHPDVAFVLAFSIIMLNTDLHNPSIKEERYSTHRTQYTQHTHSIQHTYSIHTAYSTHTAYIQHTYSIHTPYTRHTQC